MLFFLLFLLLIASPDDGRTEAANNSFYLGIGRCHRMRSSQSGSLILCPFFSQMGRTSGKDSDSAFIIGGSLNFVSNMFGTEIKRLI